MKKILALLISLFTIIQPIQIFAEADEASYATQIYVSLSGSDETGDGSIEKPYQSIEKAKTAARSADKSKGVEVILREGIYELFDSGLHFDGKDSGTVDKPVIYRSFEGESVMISGAKAINSTMYSEITDADMKARIPAADETVAVDLAALGLTEFSQEADYTVDYKLPTYGEYGLFAYGRKQSSARWPNKDDGWAKLPGVSVPGGSSAASTFTYHDRAENWKDISDVYVWGQWQYTWRPETVRIASIDTQTKTLKTLAHTQPMSKAVNMYYYNIPEELDAPGEYYIDKGNNVLYLYPLPEDENEDNNYYLTYLEDNLLEFDGAENIQVKNIDLQGSRGNGIAITQSNNIVIDGCKVRYISKKAISASGKNNVIKNCDIYAIDYGAITMSSGDKLTLESGNSEITNNHIHHYSEANLNYCKAVDMSGVGNLLSHNLMHDSYGIAVTINGPRNIMEYNEIYDVVQEVDDSAMVYTYHDLTSIDTVVRYNLLYSASTRKTISNTGTFGMYWDGYSSGRKVYGNIFYNLNRGVFINNGCFISIENNIFIDVDNPIRAQPNPSTTDQAYGAWFEATKNDPYPYLKGYWKSEYPYMYEMFYQQGGRTAFGLYRDNVIGDNLMYKCGDSILDPSGYKGNKNYFRPNITVEEDIFEDIHNLDFRIKDGMVPENFDDIIDFEKIGLLDVPK